MDVAAFVLAGGQSRRMGRDKAQLPFRGRTLLEHALATARALTPAVWIVGARVRFERWAPVVEDQFAEHGPLAGIHAALRASPAELNVVLAVDTPFVTPELLRYLLERARTSAALAVVPATQEANGGERLHPLVAVYRRALAEAAEAALRAARNQVEPVLRAAPLLIVGEAEFTARGFAADQFRNLNSPEEFERAAGGVP